MFNNAEAIMSSKKTKADVTKQADRIDKHLNDLTLSAQMSLVNQNGSIVSDTKKTIRKIKRWLASKISKKK